MNKATKVIAGSIALTAFAVAVVCGLSAGNNSSEILVRALLCMTACYFMGLVLGVVGERTIEEHVRTFITSRPIVNGVPEPVEFVDKVVETVVDSGTLTTGGKLSEGVSAG